MERILKFIDSKLHGRQQGAHVGEDRELADEKGIPSADIIAPRDSVALAGLFQ
jgi:hypothetical protein